MQLIKDLMDKKITMSEEYGLKRHYPRAISQFYSVYNLALAVLGRTDDEKDIRIRNKLWRKFLLADDEQRKQLKKKLQKFIDKDRLVIFEASNFIEKIMEDPDYGGSDYIDKSDAVLMLSYEYPE